MIRTVCTAVACLILGLSPSAVRAQDSALAEYEMFVRRSSVPRLVWQRIRDAGLHPAYDVNVLHTNPFYLRGDFDGDNKSDYVVVLTHRQVEAPDRLAVLMGSGEVAWLDRDELLRYPTLDAWEVRPVEDGPLHQSPYDERPPPQLLGDVIAISKVEASTSYLLWNGSRFVSYWVGD